MAMAMLSQRPHLVIVNDLGGSVEPHHLTMSWAGYIHFLPRLFRLSDHSIQIQKVSEQGWHDRR